MRSIALLIVLCVLLHCLTTALGSTEEECDYTLLERSVLNNSLNLGNLFKVFYSPNMPSPKSVAVHYVMEDTGQPYRSQDCGNETWYWLSSGIYFIFPPTDLNKYALYILGPLSPITGSLEKSVRVRIPAMPEDCYFNNLHQLTMTLQTYAMGKTPKTHLGFVIRECHGQRVTTMKDNRMEIEIFTTALIVVLVIGLYTIQILIFSVTVLVLRKQLPDIAKHSHDNTYNRFGLPWGIAVTSAIVSALLIAHSMQIITTQFERTNKYANFIPINLAVYYPVMFGCNIIFSTIVAKGLKMNVPGVFTVVIAFFTCGNTALSKYIITVLGVWSSVTAVQLTAGHSTFTFLALLAEPEEVICMVILYVFAVFCCIHLLAVIFTLVKIHKSRKHSLGRVLRGIGYGLGFTLLMIGALCMGFLITSAGEMETFFPNTNTTFNTIYRFISPLLLGLVGWSINGATRKWLEQMQDMRPKKRLRNGTTDEVELEESLLVKISTEEQEKVETITLKKS